MYNVLIVDDEPWIVESLRGTLDWGALGFEIVGEAGNGIEAMERIRELRPDVVFIDIRMPGMNGIELIKHISEQELPVQCIMASGYAEFEYARQAMQYGAAGYCLKPYDADEITALLAKAGSRIEQNRQLLQNQQFDHLFGREDAPGAEEEVLRLLDRLNFEWKPAQGAFAVVVQGDAPSLFVGERQRIPIRTGSGKTTYVLQGSARERVRYSLPDQLPPQARGAGIGPVFHELRQFRESVDAANIASYCYFAGGSRIGETRSESPEEGTDRRALGLLRGGIGSEDATLIRRALGEWAAAFDSGTRDIRYAFRLYNLILSEAYRTGGDYSEHYMLDYEELAGSYGTATDMLDDLGDLLAGRTDGAPPAASASEEKLASILAFVHASYREPISVQEISRTFHMHPNYLSALFKKELKVNFTKYLTGLRIVYACGMLKETKLSVGEIAEMAGYGDYFYFAKQFKRITGRTPTEFRLAGHP
ncbi:response regulator transcription factor [Paenibacillus solisilvae]